MEQWRKIRLGSHRKFDIYYLNRHQLISNFRCEKLDLDRIGNLILIDGDLNNKRSNNSIQYYYDNVPDLMKCLNYPNIETYDCVA